MERLSTTLIFIALVSIFLTVLTLITIPSGTGKFPVRKVFVVSPEPGISHYDTVAPIIKEGKELFENNCKSCHAVHKKVVGPPLKDITIKREKAWLYKWIRNSSALRASGDKQAIEIYNQYQKAEMTAFTSFTDKEIDAILEYISHDSKIVPNDMRPIVID